jgi:hypothetical protein
MLLQDLRYGLHLAARNPGFTAVVVLTEGKNFQSLLFLLPGAGIIASPEANSEAGNPQRAITLFIEEARQLFRPHRILKYIMVAMQGRRKSRIAKEEIERSCL